MPKLPPLTELRAFEAAARHMSFKLAAAEYDEFLKEYGQHAEATTATPAPTPARPACSRPRTSA